MFHSNVMKSPRKKFSSNVYVSSVGALFLVFTASAILAEETTQEKRVALRTADGKYVTAGVSGGLDLSGTAVTNKQVFAVVDVNGGKLEDGDEIKLKYYPGASADTGKTKPSFWQEEAGKIDRVNQEPSDASSKFKLKQQGSGFVLQTASGKFAAAPKAEGGLGLADAPESALVLTFEEQPAAK